MRPHAWSLAAALALASTSAQAQLTNPIRVGGAVDAVNAAHPLGRLDCESRERIRFQLNWRGDGTTFNALQAWIGAQASSCTEMSTRHPATNAVCWPIESAVVNGQRVTWMDNDFQIEARFLVDPLGGNCAAPQTSRGTINTNFLSLLVVSSAGATLGGMAVGIPFDLDPPSTPTSVSARPGEGSLEVRWSYPVATNLVDASTTGDASVSATSDLRGFWVLCDPPSSAVASDAGAGDASLDGSAGLDVPGNVIGDDAGSTACGTGFPAINLYDPAVFSRYARGGIASASNTSLLVDGLSNGGAYRCVVVAEDLAGNRTMSAPTECVSPVPVTDFWERYRADGGGATIACAARAGSRGDAQSPLITLSLAAAALAARRRRRS
jgi:hypothetical protein